MRARTRIATVLSLLLANLAVAETVRVAVASNFATTAAELGRRLAAAGPHDVEISPGSTGKLYAQIVNGAPYDVYLAADVARPVLLEQAELTVPGSRRTYAEGRLVAWSRKTATGGSTCLAALAADVPGKVAIANPQLAPYGVAAREYLQATARWEGVERRLVYGENVAQTLQFAANGGAVVALISAAQVLADGLPEAACIEPVPADLHAPIEQQVVWLRRAAENPAAAAFVEYLAGDEARALIEAAGYRVPVP